MIYTAIYMARNGAIVYKTCPAHVEREKAWKKAVSLGSPHGECLLALVCGVHPVYTYENFEDSKVETSIKDHDLFEIIP